MTITTGKFISLSGGEGAGKSSHLKRLLIAYPGSVVTREPGGSELAELGRNILLGPHGKAATPFTQTCLTFACSNDHLHKVVAPSLAKGQHVFTDRICTVCSYAYQIHGEGGNDLRDTFFHLREKNLRIAPLDLAIIIDVTPEIGMARVAKRKGIPNHFDERKIDFHERIRAGYLEYAKLFPENTVVVNGDLSEEEVWKQIKDAVDRVVAA